MNRKEYLLTCLAEEAAEIVDESLSLLTCRQCKQLVNPIFYLVQLVQKWSRFKELYARYKAASEVYAEKTKTKCEHCQKITRVRAPEGLERKIRLVQEKNKDSRGSA